MILLRIAVSSLVQKSKSEFEFHTHRHSPAPFERQVEPTLQRRIQNSAITETLSREMRRVVSAFDTRD